LAKLLAYDDEFISVWFYTDTGIVHHQVHKPLGGAPFREALMAGVELMKAHGACKWLSDDRLNGALPPEDLEWGQAVFTPSAAGVGWKYWALVVPEAAIAQLNMKLHQGMIGMAGIKVQTFSDPQEAMAWLEGCGGV